MQSSCVNVEKFDSIVGGVERMRVLIAEDEKRLAQALQFILKEKKYQADVVYNGADAYDYAHAYAYDVLLLDVMLPKQDGFTVARRLREEGNAVPIIMLTARNRTADKVEGLESGADDYMTKPFEPEELLARIKALTRRRGTVALSKLSFEDISFDESTSELVCGEESVKLNYKESELLKLFMNYPSRMFSKEMLITSVWGVDSEAGDNNVEAYISFLRRKLKFVGSHAVIRNYQKMGYKLEAYEK